jgi:hypothetical protein
VVRQTIAEVGGGNFIHKFPQVMEPLDPVGALNVETLDMRYVRVRIGLEDWEPTNDNDDPGVTNWEAFRDTRFENATFRLMQDLGNKGVIIVASAWDVPDWMVDNPTDDRERHIPPAMVPEAIESLAAWLLVARDEYGVRVSYVSFNEADIGVNVILSPEEQRALIAQAGARFAELGLETGWLLADAANMGGCLRYAKAIWEDAEVRPYLGPLACHSWDGLSAPDSTIERLGEYAQEQGLDLWITEGGWDPFLWRRRDEFPTWENALNLATVYSRVLKLGRASVLMYWQMSGRDYNTNDGARAYPILDVISQFAREFPGGTQVVQTSPNTFTLRVVAAKGPAHFCVHLVNTNIRVVPVRIEGVPDGTYHHIQLSEAGRQVVQSMPAVNGALEIELVPKSVNVLTTQAP